jgi:hypothetical protein
MGTADEEKEDYREKFKSRVKASLPKKDEAPVIGMRSNKNFITANAVEAILQGIFHLSRILHILPHNIIAVCLLYISSTPFSSKSR